MMLPLMLPLLLPDIRGSNLTKILVCGFGFKNISGTTNLETLCTVPQNHTWIPISDARETPNIGPMMLPVIAFQTMQQEVVWVRNWHVAMIRKKLSLAMLNRLYVSRHIWILKQQNDHSSESYYQYS